MYSSINDNIENPTRIEFVCADENQDGKQMKKRKNNWQLNESIENESKRVLNYKLQITTQN